MYIIKNSYKYLSVQLMTLSLLLILMLFSAVFAGVAFALSDSNTIFVPGVKRSIVSTDEERVHLEALFRDIISGDIDQVKRYIHICEDSTMADIYGNTPLMIASEVGRADIAELLIRGMCLDSKVNSRHPEGVRAINYKNIHGYTALYTAVMYANADVIDLLLGAGADSAISNDRGLSPMGYVKALGYSSVEEYSAYLKTPQQVISVQSIVMHALPSSSGDNKARESSLNINNASKDKDDGRALTADNVAVANNATVLNITGSDLGSSEAGGDVSKGATAYAEIGVANTNVVSDRYAPIASSVADLVATVRVGPYSKRYASQWQLYLIYEERSGDFREYSDVAVDIVKKAADGGDTKAIYWLGKYYFKKDSSKSIEYLQDPKIKGSVYSTGALYYLGLLYINDKRASKQAQSYLCAAADQGYSRAMAECGANYLFGKTVAVDSAKAYHYLSMGYELAEAGAIYHMGLMKYYGYGITEDKIKGLIDINQASYYGYDLAYDHVKRLRTQETLEYLSNFKRLTIEEVRTYLVSLNNAAPNGGATSNGGDVGARNDSIYGVLPSEIVCDKYTEGELFSNEYMIRSIEICSSSKEIGSIEVVVDEKTHPIYKRYFTQYASRYEDITLIFE